LAGARVLDDLAVGPAACGAVDPADDVVAGIERVDAVRQQLHPEGVDIAGLVEGVAPPARSLDESGADRLRRGAVDIEDDRMADAGARRVRLQLFEAEAVGELVDD